jgi:hypothetical protein
VTRQSWLSRQTAVKGQLCKFLKNTRPRRHVRSRTIIVVTNWTENERTLDSEVAPFLAPWRMRVERKLDRASMSGGEARLGD